RAPYPASFSAGAPPSPASGPPAPPRAAAMMSMTRPGRAAHVGDADNVRTLARHAGAYESAASPSDPVIEILARQGASGLWDAPGESTPLRATLDALLSLLRANVTTAHPVHGAQIKKAISALLSALDVVDAAERGDARLRRFVDTDASPFKATV